MVSLISSIVVTRSPTVGAYQWHGIWERNPGGDIFVRVVITFHDTHRAESWLRGIRTDRTVAGVTAVNLLLPRVCNRIEAETLGAAFANVISLAGTAAGRGELRKHPRRLFCPFDDVLDDDDGEPVGPEQIERILEFTTYGESLLVHCEYGQSRSAAVALGVAVAWGWDPGEAAQTLLRSHPVSRPFVPNERVLRLFDEALSCLSRLTRAGLACVRV